MNAGYSPMESWIHSEEGGGRIIGEACHIIDLFSYLIDAPVRSVSAASLQPGTESVCASDNKSIILEYEDGSVATLEYYSVGSREYPKEFMEVHFDEKTIVMDNYKSIHGYGVKTADIKSRQSNKGQLEELVDLYECVKQRIGGWPIPIEEMFETTMITLETAKR
jgi:predicted dehydrogenase